MKKQLLLPVAFLLITFLSHAQSDYKVVFDLTSKDSIDHRAVIRWLNEITKASADAKVEVVMYGMGTSFAIKGKSYAAEDISRLVSNKNISFKVCAIALKNQGVDQSQLLPGIQTTPDGIYEIISKQKDSWGYIKVKN
ncbi:MAG: DsrE family protein [Flavisolibacter sp.]|jgi:intracellular sulfur oxidation DsrE/DsrF family protein